MNIDDTGAWPETILGKMGEGINIIDKISAKRFSQPAEAEEAAAFVLDKLSENSWKRCTSYKGHAQPQTYLVRLTKNLLEDFSRKKYGRPRPPKWIQECGKTWVDLWTELCKEGRSHLEIVPRFTEQGHDSDWIKGTIRIIKARIPDCGKKLFEPKSLSDVSSLKNTDCVDDRYSDRHGEILYENASTSVLDNALVEVPQQAMYAEQDAAETELLRMVYSIAGDLPDSKFSNNNNNNSNLALEMNPALASFGQALEFEDIERVVLKMRYSDGLSTPAVARALKLKSYDVTVIEKKCLKRIREAAIAVGIDFESLLGQLK